MSLACAVAAAPASAPALAFGWCDYCDGCCFIFFISYVCIIDDDDVADNNGDASGMRHEERVRVRARARERWRGSKTRAAVRLFGK